MAENIVPEGFVIDQPPLPEGFVVDETPSLFNQHQALENLSQGSASPVVDQLTGTLETAEAIGGEALGLVSGGLSGIAAISPLGLATGLTDELTASNVVENVRDRFSKPPQTPQGKQTVQTLGDLAQTGIDLMNVPVANTAELIELMTGRTPEEAAAVAESIQEKGFPQTFADSVFDKTGSSLLAAMAFTLPNAVVEILGATTGARLARPSPYKEELARQMREQPTLDMPPPDEFTDVRPEFQPEFIEPTTGQPRPSPEPDLSIPGPSDRNVAQLMLDGAGNVVNDTYAIEAIKQGIDAGIVSAITASNDATKLNMGKMTQISKRGRENTLFAVDNQPGDIVGLSVLDRIKHIKEVNTKAGKEIGRIAKEELVGKPIDISDTSKEFADAIHDFGIKPLRKKDGSIKYDEEGFPKMNFKDSSLAPGDRSSIKEVLRQIHRIQKQGPLDAARAHELKRIIDRNVTYGKSQKGLGADAANVLKEYRAGIDKALDSTYDNYRIANEDYAETITALDEIQAIAGGNNDLFGPGADGLIYQMLRGFLNNSKGRTRIKNAVSELDRIARKHGGVFDDNVKMQVAFADELDAAFDPHQRGSLEGLVSRSLSRAKQHDRTFLGTAGEIVESVTKAGINTENKYKALENLLEVR